MIEKWLIEEVESKLNNKQRIVILDPKAQWQFLIDASCKNVCVLSTTNCDSKWKQKQDEMFLRYEAEKNHGTENVVFYVARELSVDSFLAEYVETGGMVELSLEWVRDKLVKKTALQVSLTDNELYTACQLGIGKDLNWWKKVVQKIETLLDLEEDILDFLDAPDKFMDEKSKGIKELYVKEFCELLGQPFQKKPFDTYAKEIAYHILDGIITGSISDKEYSVYTKWIDSREHGESFKRYLEGYKIASNISIDKVNDNHCFIDIDRNYLIQLVENINDKSKVDEIIAKVKKRLKYKKSNPYIAGWWSDITDLMQYTVEFCASSLDEVGSYYSVEFAKVDRSMRHILSYFKADKDIIKPLQEHYERMNQDMLKQWFAHTDEYHDNQKGYLVNLLGKASGKIAVIVGDGLRYEVADSVAQQLSGDIQVKKKYMYAGLPSETENNMSILYTTGNIVIAEKKEREKILVQETGRDITFMQLEDLNVTTEGQLLVLTYKDIDDAGEKMQQNMLRLVDEFEALLVQKIQLLLHMGYKEVHLVTDHGFVLTGILEESDKIPTDDIIGEKKVYERFIRTVEKTATNKYISIEKKYGNYNYINFAHSSRPFISTGKYGYAHGGFTPQEVVIPNFVFTYDRVNQLEVNITNKKNLLDVNGNLLTVKIASDDLAVDVMSAFRKVRIVMYVNDKIVDKSSIISMTAGKTDKIELSLEGANEAIVVLIDEDTKDQLDKAKVKKMQMRDLGGLF